MDSHCGRRVLAGDDDVDVVAGAQAVVHRGQQGVGVRRQVDPHDLGLLVHDVVDEPGVLVGEAVVVLAPDVAGEQVVQRGDRSPPRDAAAGLEPLGVLVEHGVDDVDERLVAVEQAVAAGEQVALQPALAQVLGQHLHDPPGLGDVLVGRRDGAQELPVGCLEHGLQAVRGGLVRSDDPEGARVRPDDVGEPRAQRRRGGRGRTSGLGDVDAVAREVGQAQVAQQLPAVGVRGGAHPRVALRRAGGELGERACRARRTAPRAGRSASTPPAGPGARGSPASRRAAPGAPATCPRRARRRPRGARSTPSACAAPARASGAGRPARPRRAAGRRAPGCGRSRRRSRRAWRPSARCTAMGSSPSNPPSTT